MYRKKKRPWQHNCTYNLHTYIFNVLANLTYGMFSSPTMKLNSSVKEAAVVKLRPYEIVESLCWDAFDHLVDAGSVDNQRLPQWGRLWPRPHLSFESPGQMYLFVNNSINVVFNVFFSLLPEKTCCFIEIWICLSFCSTKCSFGVQVSFIKTKRTEKAWWQQ